MDGCVENAECSDNEGSYICTCSSGFSGDGMSICNGELLSEPIHSSITYFPSDIDSVWSTMNAILYIIVSYLHDVHVTRQNYIHYCLLDIDECLVNNECHPMASCENTNGSFICQCKIGFTGDGSSCSGDNLKQIMDRYFTCNIYFLSS